MIQPRSYNTTYFRPKQQCNAILVVVVCLSTIGLWNVFIHRHVSYHINEVYSSKELDEKATHQIFRLVQKEGNREVERNFNFYSLEVIIAVGFRVNSNKATEFSNWAINVLKNYTIKVMR